MTTKTAADTDQTRTQLKCAHCAKVLAIVLNATTGTGKLLLPTEAALDSGIEIKCNRCKQITVFPLPERSGARSTQGGAYPAA